MVSSAFPGSQEDGKTFSPSPALSCLRQREFLLNGMVVAWAAVYARTADMNMGMSAPTAPAKLRTVPDGLQRRVAQKVLSETWGRDHGS
jgi:hypothetical protein